MNRHAKAEIIRHYRKPYHKAEKREKSRILNTIAEAAGYSRKHAIALLTRPQVPHNKRITIRPSRYRHLYETLKYIWAAANFVCGKRLQPFLPELLKSLKRHKEIKIAKQDEALLLTISASTIDRLLGPARREIRIKGRSTTKPGTLLKHQIPIRTFDEWDDSTPDFLEIDLVAHCGDSTRGEYVNTLNMTDIATGWTVCAAFMGKSQQYCVASIEEVKPSLPFPVRGIHSDNDSVFINAHLLRYCEANGITMTRNRAYKKNDAAHIEQKNWDVVRKMIGYGRFETWEQLDIIKGIHRLLSFYQNYFQPSRKLVSKKRIGARVTKKYDIAATPAQRLLARHDTPKDTKKRLRDTFCNLNPVELLRNINDLASQLYDTLTD